MNPASPAAIVEALAGIEPGDLLDGAAARVLARLDPAEAAFALAALLGRPAPDPREKKVTSALCRVIHFGAPELPADYRDRVRRAAMADGHGLVAALFTEAAARRTIDEDDARGAVDSKDMAASLGHRTQRARAERRPDRLLRLCADPHPAVIRSLLQNPRLTEAHAVRIASRRPVDAAVLEEVARAPRFIARPAVRRAVAQNPYAAPALVVSLLPSLGRPDLVEIAASGTLHGAVRDAARALLAARTPAGE